MTRKPEDYLILITKDGKLFRTIKREISDDYALITYRHPMSSDYYNHKNKLKPQFWSLPRYSDFIQRNKGKYCKWTNCGNFYETSCDETFEFIDGDITDAGFIYCPYCGKKIKDLS